MDLGFQGRARVIASAVVQSNSGVAIIDPGPSSCLDVLLGELDQHGIMISDIQALLLTHIHLDHAGSTGSLIRKNPEIKVYVHERGAAHMLDPSKLLASASRLYGEDMDRLWGEFLPVPRNNIYSLSGGERINVADRTFEVEYTPGHASHHVSFFDRSSQVAFVGDTAGVRTGRALFVMPPTPPPDIDVEVWLESIELIRKWRATSLFTTHFGLHEDAEAHLDALVEHLIAISEIAKTVIIERGDADQQLNSFTRQARVYLRSRLPVEEADLYDFAAPLALGWFGLARYWRKRNIQEA
tara:strand:- start:3197 stop:4090 length:894 start_codon:yes stop_codon:yes gene_type:complete